MKPGTIKVFTKNNSGPMAVMEYLNAEHKIDGAWLLITCDDSVPGKPRLLARVLLANLVQIIEPLPESVS